MITSCQIRLLRWMMFAVATCCHPGSNHSKRHFQRSTLLHPQLAISPAFCRMETAAKPPCLAHLSKEQSEPRQQYQRKS